jgi:hypothetical protein
MAYCVLVRLLALGFHHEFSDCKRRSVKQKRGKKNAPMMADVQRASNVLAAHWDGRTVSFRYDFLTLLRVAKQYLPQPYNPRPTGSNWYSLVTNATP